MNQGTPLASPAARARFSAYASFAAVLVYDADSSALPEGGNLLGLMRKLGREGNKAEVCGGKGGFHAGWRERMDLVDREPPSDGEEEEENEEDMIRSAMQRAQSKHQVIVDKMMDMQARQKTILKDVAEAKYKLKVAEASVEETWQAVKKPAVGEKKNSAVRSLLGATHTAGYFKHLSKYTEYYRLCTEARATWMSNNLLNSWGGVSFYIYFGPVEKQV